MAQITKDNAYDAADPHDFPAMLEVERYGRRSTAFDRIISATHDHFWDPLDRKYIDFSQPFDLDAEMVLAPEVYKKIVGMQMLVEGLAMGAFATLYQKSNDPLLVKLCQLVMTDEAFHHKFGKIWADRTVPKLSEEEHNTVEDWAVQCFQTLLFNLVNAEQMQSVYASVGIDWQEARAAIMEAFTDADRRE